VLPCCSFAHDQEALEVSEVLFERDEKRGSDTLYAVGWNAKVREQGYELLLLCLALHTTVSCTGAEPRRAVASQMVKLHPHSACSCA
jgi:hypothetical protein